MKLIVLAGAASLALASTAWAGAPVTAAASPEAGLHFAQYYGDSYRRGYDYYREPNDSGYRRRQRYYERDGYYGPSGGYGYRYERRRGYDYDDD